MKMDTKNKLISLFVCCLFLLTGCKETMPQESAYSDDEFFSRIKYVGTNETYGLGVGALPCVGNPRVVAFVVDFADDYKDPDINIDISAIEKMMFDESGKENLLSPNDSLRSFYYRSSYEKLDLNGDVFQYTLSKNRADYDDSQQIIKEIINKNINNVNWNNYDINEDGAVDGVYIILRNYPAFGSPHFVSDCDFTVGSKKIQKTAFLIGYGKGVGVETLAHETCHLLGLPDIYEGVYVNQAGSGASTIMNDHDGMPGDLPSIMKCIYDWIDPIFITGTGLTQVTLESYSIKPQVAIVCPNGDITNPNWFVIEHVTREKNNMNINLEKGGLRIWRITLDSNLINSPETFWDNGYFNSPYIYLETARPVLDEWDYYFRDGDCFTPDTNPSTDYPEKILLEDGAAIMDNMRPSGISIENIMIETYLAKLTVTIKI